LLRNKNFDNSPDMNLSQGSGWSIDANNFPSGAQGFVVSGGHLSPMYYLYTVDSGIPKLYKSAGSTNQTTSWEELNVQGNLLQSRPWPASGILLHANGASGLNDTTYGPVFANPYNEQEVFVLTSTGIQVSETGGFAFQTDTELTSLLTDGGKFPLTANFDGGNGRNVRRGVGSRATLMGTLSHMAFLRDNPKVMVAASPFTGLFYKGPGGKWISLNAYLRRPYTPISAVAIDGEAIYFVTEGRGIFRLLNYQNAR
ncbi:MAG: hypothetical protein WA639_24555, partial [Candidatus Acidiferrum sp.]